MSNCRKKGNCINRLIITAAPFALANPIHFIILCAIIIKQQRNSNKSTFRQSDYPSHPVLNKPRFFPLYSVSIYLFFSSLFLSAFYVFFLWGGGGVGFGLRLKLSKLFSHKIQMLAFSVVYFEHIFILERTVERMTNGQRLRITNV